MKARLSKYGFSRPFRLEHDLDRQDKLTTWIEYLGYEHRFYDRAASFVTRSQRRHDDAWRKLMNSNILRPGETYDVICNIDTTFQHANEEEKAENAVASAIAASSSSERALCEPHGTVNNLPMQDLADQSLLKIAIKRHESIKKHNDAVTTFLQTIRRHRCEKDAADRYSLLLRWILQQFPSIELEQSSLNAKAVSHRRASSRNLKRARVQSPDNAQEPRKCRRTEGERQCVPARRLPAVSPSLRRQDLRRKKYDLADNERPSRRLKYSSREGLATNSTPSAFSPVMLPLIPDTRATREQDVGLSPVDRPSGLLKHLRRSARIAERAKKTNGYTQAGDLHPTEV